MNPQVNSWPVAVNCLIHDDFGAKKDLVPGWEINSKSIFHFLQVTVMTASDLSVTSANMRGELGLGLMVSESGNIWRRMKGC